jgi:hypothetical protein
MDDLKRSGLFKPENRAKLREWVEASLRTARLRRPEGTAMVLKSLGIEVLQQPCADGLFICAISRSECIAFTASSLLGVRTPQDIKLTTGAAHSRNHALTQSPSVCSFSHLLILAVCERR